MKRAGMLSFGPHSRPQRGAITSGGFSSPQESFASPSPRTPSKPRLIAANSTEGTASFPTSPESTRMVLSGF